MSDQINKKPADGIRVYRGSGNKVFDADILDNMLKQPQRFVKEAARLLCNNRWSFCHTPCVEHEVVTAMTDCHSLVDLVREVVLVLNGEDGDLRVGAAELLGVITPSELKDEVVRHLRARLDDTYMRDYVYGGYQGDEEDRRTVAECAQQSLAQLATVS